MAMPWVGLVLYALHIPAILTAAVAGTKLLNLPIETEREPFLSPEGPEPESTVAATVAVSQGGPVAVVSGRQGDNRPLGDGSGNGQS